MTLQASGAISLGNVNTELGLSATANISLNAAAVRTLAAVSSGAIAMSNLYGKSNVSFSPAGGASAGTAIVLSVTESEGNVASQTITCSQSAVWTYTRSGSFGTPTTGSTTAASRSFTLTNTTGSIRSTTWTVSATAGGVTKYWNVQLQNDGYA
jgi:hypothetical protein